MKPEGLIESIRQRLLNLSRGNGEAFDFLLARYGVERFLHRLSLSAHAGEFVLKGSMLFHVWNRRMHRSTRDLDLLGAGAANVESVREAILDVLRTDAPDDGLVFEEATLVVAPIRENHRWGSPCKVQGETWERQNPGAGGRRVWRRGGGCTGDAGVHFPAFRSARNLDAQLSGV